MVVIVLLSGWLLLIALGLVLARAAAVGDRVERPVRPTLPVRPVPTAEERFGRGRAGADGLPTGRREAADETASQLQP